MPKSEITWYAPEFRYQHKDLSWYWFSIIGAGVLFLIALWQKNLLFAVFVIVAELMVIIWAKEFPKNIRFKLDKKGVQIGNLKSYFYEELDGFHIHEPDEDGIAELILKTNRRLHPYVKILIIQTDAPQIKEFLKEHLPEIEYEESLSDNLAKMIGF